MKKLLLTTLLVLACAFGAFAGDTNGLFNSKELSLSIGSSYVVDYQASSVKSAFSAPYDLNFTAGASYFVTRNLGVEAAVPFYQSKGVSVSEAQAGLVFRLPLAKTTPLLKNVAPYVGVGGVYNWQNDSSEKWAYIGKAGAEYRLNSKWGVFVEGQYRNKDFDWGNGATTIAGGLRLVL